MSDEGHRCPIPTCRKPLSRQLFMCAAHQRMIPPVLQRAIDHSSRQMRLARAPDVYQMHQTANRQARAYAFASVCDQLGIDAEKLMMDADAARAVTATPMETQGLPTLAGAIKRELNG